MDDIQSEYTKLMSKINNQKVKYKNLVYLLSQFIDQLISADPTLVDGTGAQGAPGPDGKPQVDIHLDLDKIKNAEDLEIDLDNKSMLALALVLLKQVQPLVTDFEVHESRFQASLSMMRSQ